MGEDYWEQLQNVYKVKVNSNIIFQQNHISKTDILETSCDIGQATNVTIISGGDD